MSLKIKIDVEGLAKQCKAFALEAKQDLEAGVQKLAAQTHGHVMQKSQQELSPQLQLVFKGEFGDNVRLDTVSEGVHVVSIGGSAYWIEEGIPPNTDMKTDKWLFKNGSKVSKDGYQYKTISFKHSKRPAMQTGYEQMLTSKIRADLKSINRIRKKEGQSPIPWTGKLETDANGSPRIGKLHEITLHGGKAKSSWGYDPLYKMIVMQTAEKDKKGNVILNKQGKPKVRRDFFTFRTASTNPHPSENGGIAPKDKFIHPGFEAKKFLDEAETWAITYWETQLLPEIISKWK